MSTLRWGILGAGSAAGYFADGLTSVADAELRAVASRREERSRAFASRHRAQRAYASYEELLADRDVDIVYVATPNAFHRNHCMAALEAGKPVLCEKPFALDAAEARQVIELARRRGLFCMEAMWTRFLPAVQEVKTIVDSGRLGDIRLVSASLGYACPPSETNLLFRPEMGGGALLDLGVYVISLVSLVLGQPSAIVGAGTIGSTGVDEQASAVLSFAGGAQAVIAVSLRAQLPSEALIVGAKAQLRVHAPLYRPEAISLTPAPAPAPRGGASPPQGLAVRIKNTRLVRSAYHRIAPVRELLRGHAETIIRPVDGNGYNYEAAEAMRCLREGTIESPMMTHQETIGTLETADAIRRSWQHVRILSPA